jgi:hypothetical protein
MTAVTSNPYTYQSLQFTAQKLPRIEEHIAKNERKLGKIFTLLPSQLVKTAINQGRIHFFPPSIVCFPHELVPVHINRFGVYPTSSIRCQFDAVSNITDSQGWTFLTGRGLCEAHKSTMGREAVQFYSCSSHICQYPSQDSCGFGLASFASG